MFVEHPHRGIRQAFSVQYLSLSSETPCQTGGMLSILQMRKLRFSEIHLSNILQLVIQNIGSNPGQINFKASLITSFPHGSQNTAQTF